MFAGDYLTEQVTHGYAITVHSAQGVTAETTHAVLGESASRNLLYVAMTRGRAANHAYLYQRAAGEADHQHAAPETGVHVAHRGTSVQAARLVREVIGRDEPARTAHQSAANTPVDLLPDRVASLLARRDQAVLHRRSAYQKAYRALDDRAHGVDRSRGQQRHRDQGHDLSL